MEIITTPIGANIGEALEAAMQQVAIAPVDIATRTPEAKPAVQPKRHIGTLRMVGIEMLPEAHNVARGESPLTSLDATLPAIGKIIIGPETDLSGRLRFEQFVQHLRIFDLRLNNFMIVQDRDRQGRLRKRIVRGSLIAEPTGCYTCPECKKVYSAPTPNELKQLQHSRAGSSRPHCINSSCTLKPALQWRPDNPRMGAGDPRAKRLFSAFSAYAGSPCEETPEIIPEAWAEYPKGRAPADDTPWGARGGRLNQYRADKLGKGGFVLRPIKVALAAQSTAIEAIRMSVPVEWASTDIGYTTEKDPTTGVEYQAPVVPDWVSERSEDGKTGYGWRPCMSVGWLSPETLGGTVSEHFGYTVRLCREFQHLASGRV